MSASPASAPERPAFPWVSGSAIVLGAVEGAAPDANDPATKACTPPPGRDYTKFLNADALKGARIGIPRAFYYDKITAPGTTEPRGGLTPEQMDELSERKADLKAQLEALESDIQRVAQQFRDLLPAVNIANDDFIRTTEPRHYAASQELWRRVRERGRSLPGTASHCRRDR